MDQGSLPRVRSTLSARWKKRALTRVLASFLPAAAWGRCEGSWGSTGDFARLRVRSWCQGIRKGAAATFGGGVGLPRSRPRCAPSISARADDRCAAFPASLGRKLDFLAPRTKSAQRVLTRRPKKNLSAGRHLTVALCDSRWFRRSFWSKKAAWRRCSPRGEDGASQATCLNRHQTSPNSHTGWCCGSARPGRPHKVCG